MHAKSFRWVVLPLGLSVLAALAAGCGSRASTLCSLECDCEHCNDYEDDFKCEGYETQQEVAAAYACADQWDTWAACVEERGRCEEEEARFTTSSPGSCSGTEPTGDSCITDSDCGGFGRSCSAGMCVQRVCAGNGDSCEDDADCSGEDACQNEEDALSKCIDDASEHGGIRIDFD